MSESPSKRKRYDDACAAAHALDIVGDRWMLLVIREMMFGPRRFGDIRRGLPGISANVLTQRLEELEALDIVQRRKLPPPAGTQVYELTEWGLRSEPIFLELGRWACGSPGHDPTRPFSAASMFLSFRTMIDRDASAGIDATFGFKIGEEQYVASMQGGTIKIEPADPDGADVIFTAVPEVMAAVIYGGIDIEAMEKDGVLQIEGECGLAERFVTLFPLPNRAQNLSNSG